MTASAPLRAARVGTSSRRWPLLALALLLAATTRAGERDAPAASPESILAAAFANRYEVNTISRLELSIRNRTGRERRRIFRTARKIIDGRMHSIGRITSPEYLRGMTVLVIEADAGRHDSFVYLPSLRRVRRITTSQRADAFLGSDLTYEDFDRPRVDDYRIELRRGEQIDGEPCYVIRGRPSVPYSYDHVDFLVARSDHSILETRYYKRGAEEPYRILSARRETMLRADGHVLPTRVEVHDRVQGTRTEVRVLDLLVNPEIDDRIFSLATLDQERELPTLSDGGKAPASP